MPLQVEILGALKLAGMTVDEILGWQTRGRTDLDPHGSVDHHTAGPRAGVQPSLGTVINGRSDLPGPLCNVHLPREESLRCNLVAAGKANHAGLGGWKGLSGNSSVWGLEVEHCGYPDEPLSAMRRDGMVRIHAAFAYVSGFDPTVYTCQHYEWAPTRKIDFCRPLLDPDLFRRDVAARLAIMRGAPVPPPPTHAPILRSSPMAMARNKDGRLECFDVGPDNQPINYWQVKPNGLWSGVAGFGTIPGGIHHIVGAEADADGRVEVMVVDFFGRRWLKYQLALKPDGTFNGWSEWTVQTA